MILRTPATATSDGPGADVWRRTDGGSQKRRRTAPCGAPPGIKKTSSHLIRFRGCPTRDGPAEPVHSSCLPPSRLLSTLSTLPDQPLLAQHLHHTQHLRLCLLWPPGSPRSGTGSASSSGQEALLMQPLPTFPLTSLPFLPQRLFPCLHFSNDGA